MKRLTPIVTICLLSIFIPWIIATKTPFFPTVYIIYSGATFFAIIMPIVFGLCLVWAYLLKNNFDKDNNYIILFLWIIGAISYFILMLFFGAIFHTYLWYEQAIIFTLFAFYLVSVDIYDGYIQSKK